MPRSSSLAATLATQESLCGSRANLRWDPSNLRSLTAKNDEQIRTLLTVSLPHGSKKIAALVLWGDEHKSDRISKQLNGEEHLRADVCGVALWILRQHGLLDTADRIAALLDHARVIEIRARLSVDADGTLRLEAK